MTVAVLVLYIGLAGPLLIGCAILWPGPLAILRRMVGGQKVVDGLLGLQARLVGSLGRYRAALLIVAFGLFAVFLVCLSVGLVAGSVEQPFDVPILAWSQAHFPPGDAFGQAMTFLTQMGDARPMTVIAAIAAVVFAVLWRKHDWWVPGLVLAVGLEGELVLQHQLAVIVNRGHPPNVTGTFPSGGTARVMIVFGLIVVLWFLTRPGRSQRERRAAWVAVALLTATECFTRLYLLQHWASDVVGAWIFGALMLGVLVAGTLTIVRRGARRDPATPPGQLVRISPP